jgi:tetratricopeptide (TPR) repeat protein
LLVFCLVVALGAAVAYLLAERNQRHFRMRSQGGIVFIERGRLLPIGYEPFAPGAKDLQSAYAPIKVPAGEKVDEIENFEDRVELDRALFSLLAGWARARLQANDAESFEMASGYVTRCSLLPGLSEEQRSELKSLRADLAYRNGKRIAYAIADDFEKAVAELKLALELGTSRPSDADAWVAKIDKWAQDYRSALADRPKPEGAPRAPMIESPAGEPTPQDPDKPKGEAL